VPQHQLPQAARREGLVRGPTTFGRALSSRAMVSCVTCQQHSGRRHSSAVEGGAKSRVGSAGSEEVVAHLVDAFSARREKAVNPFLQFEVRHNVADRVGDAHIKEAAVET
jgi:hypothetical protein